jgi:hypothetical protein
LFDLTEAKQLADMGGTWGVSSTIATQKSTVGEIPVVSAPCAAKSLVPGTGSSAGHPAPATAVTPPGLHLNSNQWNMPSPNAFQSNVQNPPADHSSSKQQFGFIASQ